MSFQVGVGTVGVCIVDFVTVPLKVFGLNAYNI